MEPVALRGSSKQISAVVLPVLLLAVAVALSYRDFSDHAFLFWDDRHEVYHEQVIGFSFENVARIFTNFSSLNWIPVTTFSFAVNHWLWGDSVYHFKLVNIIIHFLNSLLVFALSLKILRHCRTRYGIYENDYAGWQQLVTATLAALLFAIHPRHVESVIWVVERKDVLCAMFYLGSILAFLSYGRSGKRIWYFLCIVSGLLALLSIPMAVSLPVVIIVLDIFVLDHGAKGCEPSMSRFSGSLKQNYPLLLLSAIFVIVTVGTQQDAIRSLGDISVLQRLVNVSYALVHYWYSIFFPEQLVAFYPYPEGVTHLSLLSVLPWLGLLLFFYILFQYSIKRNPLPLLGFGLFILMVLPVLGIVTVGGASMADRYTYLPSVSLYLLISYALIRSVWHMSIPVVQSLCAVGAVFFLVYLSSVTASYIQTWKNDQTLWERVHQYYPYRSSTVYLNLGNVYFEQQDYHRALQNYFVALELEANSRKVLQNIANTYLKLDQADKAQRYIALSVLRNPDNVGVLLYAGDYHFSRGRLDEAQTYYQAALQADPNNIHAVFKAAVMSKRKGDLKAAMDGLSVVLQQEPGHKGALYLLANIYLEQGNRVGLQKVAKILNELDGNDQLAKRMLKLSGVIANKSKSDSLDAR